MSKLPAFAQLLSVCFLGAIGLWPVVAHSRGRDGDAARDHANSQRISGRRTGGHSRSGPLAEGPALDGSGNNLADPEMGATGTRLLRLVPADYSDRSGLFQMAGRERPGPRTVSNIVVAQPESRPNSLAVSDFFWQWGQFVDHDVDFTEGANPPEPADIPIPADDPWFSPATVIPFHRSAYDPNTGVKVRRTRVKVPRQQVNQITAWIDGSMVYGSDIERAEALRTLDGTGKLRTSLGDFLPFNIEGLENAGGPGADFFLAGDVRANEQAALTAMHTLFVREHNWWAERIAAAQPRLSGEEIYQRARLIVIAEIQVITYREFLPTLLGPDPLPPYRGYDPDVDATISNEFSTAAYRFGHSALSETLLRLDADGSEIAAGHLALRDAFFAPSRITDEGGIDPFLRGLASQVCQTVDIYVNDAVRNFLFGPPGAGGLDLAALNIQRGRDHGLPSYAEVRDSLGLGRPRRFSDVTSDPEVESGLAAAYGDVEAIDLWVGGLAEDPLPGAMVGELVSTVVGDQFAALRDGDRFWYTRTLDRQQREEVEDTRLADIIRRNTEIGSELSDDVFHVPSNRDRRRRRSHR